MQTVAVFGASQCDPDGPEWNDAVHLGTLLAKRGFRVATGGYGGIMEAVSMGAHQAGGAVVGVTAPAVFPNRPGANAFVTEETRANSLSERIHELTRIADGAIAMPGSIGTLTELMMAWNLGFVARFTGSEPKPVVAVGNHWESIVTMLTGALQTDGSLVHCVETVEQAADAMAQALARVR